MEQVSESPRVMNTELMRRCESDTMAYTSSALSFLLEDLGKTVVCLISPLIAWHIKM